MSVPPQQVPDGLSPEEYSRLAALYSLMGLEAQAFEAAGKGASDTKADNAEDEAVDEQSQEALAALSNIFSQLLTTGGNPADPAAMEEMKQELQKLGLPEDAIATCFGAFSSLFAQTSEPPPSEVPENLSAQEYYDLGVRYKNAGWTEQARDALQLAIELDPEGDIGRHALRYLRSKIPRFPVPMLAVQTNIQGFNEMASGDAAAARETFEELIEEYPDFEWPMGNLGSLMLQWGNIDEAKKHLLRAVEINPYYLNGWLHLARTYAVDSNLDEAYRCLRKAEEIGADDGGVAHVRHMVDLLKSKM